VDAGGLGADEQGLGDLAVGAAAGELVPRQVRGQDQQMERVGQSPGDPDPFDPRLLRGLRHPGAVSGRTGEAHERVHRHQRLHAVRMRGRDQHAQLSSVTMPNKCRAFGADRIHHRADIVHPLLQRRQVLDGVRQPDPTRVEEDQSPAAGEGTPRRSTAGVPLPHAGLLEPPGSPQPAWTTTLGVVATPHWCSHVPVRSLAGGRGVPEAATVDSGDALWSTHQLCPPPRRTPPRLPGGR